MEVKLQLNGTTTINGTDVQTIDYTTLTIDDEKLDMTTQESFVSSVLEYYNSSPIEITWQEDSNCVQPIGDETNEYVSNWVEKSIDVLTEI